MPQRDTSGKSGQVRREEAERIRLRVRTSGTSVWRIFITPVLFFLVSFLLVNLHDAGTISTAQQWIAFGVCAVAALVLTLLVIDGQVLIRRGHRIGAPTLVLYLVAVRGALEAQDRWGTNAFIGAFLFTMLVLIAYSTYIRRHERVAPGATYVDHASTAAPRSLILAMGEVDRVDRQVLFEIVEMKEKVFDSSLEKLRQANYVSVSTRDKGKISVVLPTTYLRRSAREQERDVQKASANRLGWLGKKRPSSAAR